MYTSERSYYPQLDEEEVQALDSDMHHVVPFRWGSFRVTQAASEAYKLVPLSGDAIVGDVPEVSRLADGRPSVDVWLHGPEERTLLDSSKPAVGEWPKPSLGYEQNLLDIASSMVTIRAAQHPGGMVITARHGGSAAWYANFLREQQAEPELEMAADYPEEEQAYEEDVANYVPQMLIHAAAGRLAYAASDIVQDWGRQRAARRYQHLMVGYGASGVLVSGGVIAGNYVYDQLSSPMTGPMVAVVGAVGTYFAVRESVRYGRLANLREQHIAEVADTAGDHISDDVHHTYCSTHFDEQQMRALGLQDNPED